MTIQELLKKIHAKGLNDYDLSKELKSSYPTNQSTLWKLRLGVQKRTNSDRYQAIENVYKKILKAEK